MKLIFKWSSVFRFNSFKTLFGSNTNILSKFAFESDSLVISM